MSTFNTLENPKSNVQNNLKQTASTSRLLTSRKIRHCLLTATESYYKMLNTSHPKTKHAQEQSVATIR